MGLFGPPYHRCRMLCPPLGSIPTSRILEVSRVPNVGEQIQLAYEDSDTPTSRTYVYEVVKVVWGAHSHVTGRTPIPMTPTIIVKIVHVDRYDDPYPPGVLAH